MADLRLDLQKTMQRYAGVFRTGELLKEGHKKVLELYRKVPDIKVRWFLSNEVLILILCVYCGIYR